MINIVILCGSPSEKSTTNIVLQYLQDSLENEGHQITHFSVLDFSPADLAYGHYNSPKVRESSNIIENADGIIIGSPVNKASYTGVLKAFLDLLPEGVFKDKPVLPIMVGGSPAHLLAIDFALKPLITTLKGKPCQGIYILNSHVDKTDQRKPVTDLDTINRLHYQLHSFLQDIRLGKQWTF
ncbi:NADPH-dependent FMN reductase [Bacillus litorisediminis]|uniref:NADPH-dependent FMN reductase n=1 Tax=Bacillus litorisediminis TaxID=2922713 RepID=UPI001FAF936D|nr:NADPH-dependent FMN reductase [Bacillus litorisediminis]